MNIFQLRSFVVTIALTVVPATIQATEIGRSCSDQLVNFGTAASHMNTQSLKYFRLGGGIAGDVYRVALTGKENQEFARKIYFLPESKTSEGVSLQILREALTSTEGVRVVVTLGNNDPLTEDFEFIPGQHGASLAHIERFGDTIPSIARRLSKVVEAYLNDRFPSRVSNFHGIMQVQGTEIRIHLKPDGFIRDSRKGDVVIVDPW